MPPPFAVEIFDSAHLLIHPARMSFSITTRNGDRGSTSLFSGELVPKYSARTDAYGDVDELNSVLGTARAACTDAALVAAVHDIQQALFIVCSELATTRESLQLLPRRLDAEMLEELTEKAASLEQSTAMPAGFIIPGGTPAGAALDHARTIARRCERKVVHLRDQGVIENEELIAWLNRLSDYLWLLARKAEGDRVILKDA